MKGLVVGKVETDPLIHYGGIFNTIESMLLLSLISFFVLFPFLKDGRFRNLLFYLSSILPILNMFYRNNNQFVGGVFLGHLFFLIGVVLISYLTYSGFERVRINESLLTNKRFMLFVIIVIFIVRGVFLFGSRPTDSGIYSGVGGILYLHGESPFRDYWGVVSIGARYGPMLYFAYVPFVPIAYLTRHLLWGEALTPWNSISNVPISVATSYTGALFYEALIIFILIKSFPKYGYFAAMFYMTASINSLILSVNANELPQTSLFLLALYLLKKPIISSLLFVASSLMKIYPIVLAIPMGLSFDSTKKWRFYISLIVFFGIGWIYWLYEASLAPPELRTNPIRDIIFYQKDPGAAHSLWYFLELIFNPITSHVVMVITMLFIVLLSYKLVIKKGINIQSALGLSINALSTLIVVNRSPHPGYYYFVFTLVTYLFFYSQEFEDNRQT
ncbi:MAG: hypothetical protein N2746_03715 [Deltaproteobacteria bacterium]|nr:hypothetical protein [Deltaproteobacteria bacterium]